jgi:hypothetical protein
MLELQEVIFIFIQGATIVIYYLMKTLSLNFDTAVKIVRIKRPIVQPNEGFEKILRLLDN